MSRRKLRLLAEGHTSKIYYHTDQSKVVKVLQGERAEPRFNAERSAYERLDRSDRANTIVRYFGVDDQETYGLVLERLPLGDLYNYLWEVEDFSAAQRRSWARDAVKALAFVHYCGVLHCDIHAVNMFLGQDLTLKLGDFGAASVDGSRPLMMYRSSHQLWVQNEGGEWNRELSIASEIFALGCVFYNIESHNNLFASAGHELEHDELVRKLKAREYPEIRDYMVLGPVIAKCWSLEYKTMDDILKDLVDVRDP